MPLMTSTRRITGTGFMKCRPTCRVQQKRHQRQHLALRLSLPVLVQAVQHIWLPPQLHHSLTWRKAGHLLLCSMPWQGTPALPVQAQSRASRCSPLCGGALSQQRCE